MAPLLESAGAARGLCCTASCTGLRAVGLASSEMCVQRAGAVLPAASAPLPTRLAALGAKPMPSCSGHWARTPCVGLDPGPIVGGCYVLSRARLGASGAFLIISAWVTRGFL